MIRKHSLTIRGHRTSISIEDAFWRVLEDCAVSRNVPLAQLVAGIDAHRQPETNLSSALRLFALDEVLKARDAARLAAPEGVSPPGRRRP